MTDIKWSAPPSPHASLGPAPPLGLAADPGRRSGSQTVGDSIMWWSSILKAVRPRNNRRTSSRQTRRAMLRPNIERLESRDTPSIAFHVGSEFLGDYAYDTAVGDFNKDGRPGLATATGGGGGDGSPDDGTGGLGEPPHILVGTQIRGVGAADFDGDGITDLVAVDYGSNAVNLLRGNGDGTFQAPVNYSTASNGWQAAVADFNGDGRPDVAVVEPGTV